MRKPTIFLGFLFLMAAPLWVTAQTWSSADVGAVNKPGSDSYNSTTGTYTLSGAGVDIWGTSDSYHFVYQTITGDGELTARVVSVQNTNPWAKAGVMIRQDTTAGSVQGMTVVTPGEGVAFQYRATTGGSSSNIQTPGIVAPYWVKIIKDGSIITSYSSPDGASWTLLGFTHLPFTGPADIGLCVCSHTTSALCTATFDNINLVNTPTFAAPMPWLDQDIGAVLSTQSGALHYENNLWTVYGAGSDVWGVSDALHYVYEPLSGDGQIITEILGQSNTNAWAKSGIMLRQDLTPGSPHVSLFTTPGNGIVLQSRGTENGSSSTQTVATSFQFPTWLKLVRSGSQVFASLSSNGTNWTTVATTSINMTSSAYVGLAVCSHNSNATSMAVFDNVQTAPPLLTAESVSDTTVNLYWPSLANPSDIAKYAILRNGQQVATSPVTSFEDVQLTPSTSYSYQVTALDANNNVLGTSSTLTVTTSTPLLPPPWEHEDIGSPGVIVLGGYSQEDAATQTFTLVGSGVDFWEASDSGQYAWQSLIGNGQIIARVKSETPTNSWTKAGIMLRGSTASNDLQALLALSPSNGVLFEARTGVGSNDVEVTDVPATGPIWLKLIRQGNVITAYQSPDGMGWTDIGSETVAFGTTIDVGLALTSHNVDGLATATFDNVSIMTGNPTETTPPTAPQTVSLVAAGDVSDTIKWTPATDEVGVTGYQVYRNGQLVNSTTSLQYTDTGLSPGTSYSYAVVAINYAGLLSPPSSPLDVTTAVNTLPAPWQHFEIGSLALAGSDQTTSSGYVLQASGVDIWNNLDSFGYIAQPFTGNGQIILQVSSLIGPSAWTKVGPMIRATTDPGSPQASIFITPGNGIAFQYRTAQGANSSTVAGPNITAPVWLQLSRNGTIITALESADGVTWNAIGHVTLPTLPNTAYFGMAETSHDNGVLATATFNNVAVGAPGTDSPLPAAWQILYFGQTGINPSTLSPAGDGYTLLQEYQLQRNPLDYYQGTPPTITIVSGNNQSAPAASVLPAPLVISVTHGVSQTLSNAPVTFSVGSGGSIASSAMASGSSSLTVQTGSNGQAIVYLTLPTQAGTYPVNVSVVTNETYGSSGTVTQETSFSETAASLLPAVQTFGGYQQTLLVKAAGTLEATGRNHLGQLGLTPSADVLTFSPVSGITQAASAATGWGHSLVLNKAGTVLSFGDNYFGQLGDGTTTDHSTPTLVSGLTGIVAVAVGENYSVALKNDGTVWTWGNNAHGQLGQGDEVDRPVPTQISGLTNISAIASGRTFVLALTKSGTVYSWGANEWGQLGNGTTSDQPTPAPITGLSAISTIGAGANHGLAINSTGQVLAWGQNAFGQVTGSVAIEPTPQALSGVTAAQSIAGGWDHTLILSNQTVYALGANDVGQLGQGSQTSSLTPLAIPNLAASTLNSGADHAGTVSGSQLTVWGGNLHGQLGNGTTTGSLTPTGVSY